MLDTWVQCVLFAGSNCVHRVASSSRALSSSPVQSPDAAPIKFDVPRQLVAISKCGNPPGAGCDPDGWGRVAVPADPVVSRTSFAQAAMRGLLCASRARQEACRSVDRTAAARCGPQ